MSDQLKTYAENMSQVSNYCKQIANQAEFNGNEYQQRHGEVLNFAMQGLSSLAFMLRESSVLLHDNLSLEVLNEIEDFASEASSLDFILNHAAEKASFNYLLKRQAKVQTLQEKMEKLKMSSKKEQKKTVVGLSTYPNSTCFPRVSKPINLNMFDTVGTPLISNDITAGFSEQFRPAISSSNTQATVTNSGQASLSSSMTGPATLGRTTGARGFYSKTNSVPSSRSPSVPTVPSVAIPNVPTMPNVPAVPTIPSLPSFSGSIASVDTTDTRQDNDTTNYVTASSTITFIPGAPTAPPPPHGAPAAMAPPPPPTTGLPPNLPPPISGLQAAPPAMPSMPPMMPPPVSLGNAVLPPPAMPTMIPPPSSHGIAGPPPPMPASLSHKMPPPILNPPLSSAAPLPPPMGMSGPLPPPTMINPPTSSMSPKTVRVGMQQQNMVPPPTAFPPPAMITNVPQSMPPPASVRPPNIPQAANMPPPSMPMMNMMGMPPVTMPPPAGFPQQMPPPQMHHHHHPQMPPPPQQFQQNSHPQMMPPQFQQQQMMMPPQFQPQQPQQQMPQYGMHPAQAQQQQLQQMSPAVYVRATFPYQATQPDEMNMLPGDIIRLVGPDLGDGWLEGWNETRQTKGLFPSTYIQQL